jgi:hypothetical protein
MSTTEASSTATPTVVSTAASSGVSSAQVTSDISTTTNTANSLATTAVESPTTTAAPSSSTNVVTSRSAPSRRQANSTSLEVGDDLDYDTEDPYSETDSANHGNFAVTDAVADPGGAQFDDSAEKALDLSQDEQSEDGITFTTLVDVNQTFQLFPGNDGNMYAAEYKAGSTSSAGLFAQYDNIVFGDDSQRVLHFYPDEMAVYNVSRIRFSLDTLIPKTADAITLSPVDYDQADSANPTVYFAVTTTQMVYSLVMCNFKNNADSKVFIVNDQSGLDALKNNANIVYTVTGASVNECFPLAMVSGGNGTTPSA